LIVVAELYKTKITEAIWQALPFSLFHYDHPQQQGSASLKRVLPAITGRGYEGLEFNEGQLASIAFQAITYIDVPVE